jgi:hypothetical protein
MPIAHRDKTPGIQPGMLQPGLQGIRLLLSEPPDRRSSANYGIVMFDFFGPSRRDQLRERLPPDPREREVNNVGIAEKVIKKWLDGGQGVGTAKLEKYYPYAPSFFGHPPKVPNNADGSYSTHHYQSIRPSSL